VYLVNVDSFGPALERKIDTEFVAWRTVVASELPYLKDVRQILQSSSKAHCARVSGVPASSSK
jgi:hypothetical protein